MNEFRRSILVFVERMVPKSKSEPAALWCIAETVAFWIIIITVTQTTSADTRGLTGRFFVASFFLFFFSLIFV